jgi:SAM-dependent methyltransferase
MSRGIYDEFVPYYDLVYTDRSDEIAFYRSLLRADDRSVLDLGCGTGTLTGGVAADLSIRHGHRASVIGVDHSIAMLQSARHRHRGPLWVQGDLSLPPVRGPFDLVYCAFNTLQMLATDEAVLETLRACRDLLGIKGLFAFDIYNPACSAGAAPPDVRTGRVVNSFTDVSGHQMEILEDATEAADGRSVQLDWRVMERSGCSPAPRASLSLRLRHHWPASIDETVRAAGLRIIQKFGDVRKTPFDEGSSIKQVVVCSR